MEFAEQVDAWLGGADASVVAPFSDPSEVAGWAVSRGRDVVLVAPTEAAAVVLGASAGLTVLVRATPRPARDRWFARPAGRRGGLVTSIETLGSPLLREELAREVPGAPWVELSADLNLPVHPANAGRAAALEAARGPCRAGGLLKLHRAVADAPVDAVVIPGKAGPVRSEDRGDGIVTLLARAGGGVFLRRPSRGTERMLGEAGLAVRTHRTDRARVRDWEMAEVGLRKPATGVDALRAAEGGWSVAGRWTVRTRAPASPGELATPAEAPVAFTASARASESSAIVDVDSLDDARRVLEEHEEGRIIALPGGMLSAELVADLAAVGMLADLRPTGLRASIADQRRFRPPFTDRAECYRLLQARYAEVAAGWTLEERARLALTDRAPRDLGALGRALGMSPADLSDLLRAMDHDSIVAVRVESMGDGNDWVARPGPRWSEELEVLVAEIAKLREERNARKDAARALLVDPVECRAVAVAVALGVETEACGGCELCDVGGVFRPSSSAGGSAGWMNVHTSPSRRRSATALFAGLDEAVQHRSERTAGSAAGRVRAALASPVPATLEGVVHELGDAAVLVHAAFIRRTQGPAREVPDELVDDIVSALAAERSPGGLPAKLDSRTEASRGAGGRLELVRTEGLYRGLQILAPAPPDLETTIRAIAEHAPGGVVAALRDASVAAGRWNVWTEQLRRSVADALNSSQGLPELDDVLPDLTDVPASPGWSDLFALSALAAAGAPSQALALAEHARGPAIDLVVGVIRALAGDWEGLWRGGRDQLRRRSSTPTVLARLELRAALGMDELSPLAPTELLTWLERTRGEAAVSEDNLSRVIDALTGGRPETYDRLADGFEDQRLRELLARRAMAQGLLSRGLASSLVQVVVAADASSRDQDLASLLLSQVSRAEPPLADAAWSLIPPEFTEDGVRSVLAGWEGAAADALVAAADRRRQRREHAQAAQDRLRAAGAQGKLQAFGASLARLLAPDDGSADREAMGLQLRASLEEAQTEGWLGPILKVLRAQVRRYPTDPERTVWLARALLAAERWAEAERAFEEAAEAAGLDDRRTRRLEAADAFFRAGEHDRGLRAIDGLSRGRPDRALGAAVRTWAEDGVLGTAARPLTRRLRDARTGIYAGALRALEKA